MVQGYLQGNFEEDLRLRDRLRPDDRQDEQNRRDPRGKRGYFQGKGIENISGYEFELDQMTDKITKLLRTSKKKC